MIERLDELQLWLQPWLQTEDPVMVANTESPTSEAHTTPEPVLEGHTYLYSGAMDTSSCVSWSGFVLDAWSLHVQIELNSNQGQPLVLICPLPLPPSLPPLRSSKHETRHAGHESLQASTDLLRPKNTLIDSFKHREYGASKMHKHDQ